MTMCKVCQGCFSAQDGYVDERDRKPVCGGCATGDPRIWGFCETFARWERRVLQVLGVLPNSSSAAA